MFDTKNVPESFVTCSGAMLKRLAVIAPPRILNYVPILDESGRDPLPAGHPRSWSILVCGTLLDGEVFAMPTPGSAAAVEGL